MCVACVQTGHFEQPMYEKNLRTLSEMGFNDQKENIRLLKQHNNNMARVVTELLTLPPRSP